MEKVSIVTVVDFGEGETSVWGVFTELSLAQKYADHLNSKGTDIEASVSSHEVSDSYNEDE